LGTESPEATSRGLAATPYSFSLKYSFDPDLPDGVGAIAHEASRDPVITIATAASSALPPAARASREIGCGVALALTGARPQNAKERAGQ
jgi:hypothetical protein